MARAVDTDVDRVVGDVLARVGTRALTDEMTAAFGVQLPAHRALPAEVLWGPAWESSLAWTELLLAMLREDRAPSQAEMEEIRATARSQAVLGLTIDEILQAGSLLVVGVWQRVAELAQPAEVAALAVAAPRVFALLEVLSDVFSIYLRDGHHARAGSEREARERYDAALRGDAPRAGTGWPGPARQLRPFELARPGATAWEHATIAAELRDEGILATTQLDRVVGLAPADVAADEFPGPPVVVALGSAHDVVNLADGVEELANLLDVAIRTGRRGVVHATEHVPERLLSSNVSLADAMIAQVLAPLSGGGRPGRIDLLGTLVAYLEHDLDRQGAAAALGIHPNSLTYRLARISELTGLRFDRADDLALMALAVRALDGPRVT